MNAATPFPWSEPVTEENSRTIFRSIFEHAPIAVARCNREGAIVDMNRAFERTLVRTFHRDIADGRSLYLCDLGRPQDRDLTELLLRDFLDSRRDDVTMEIRISGPGQASAKCIAWRQPGGGGKPDHVLLIAEPIGDTASATAPAAESLLQTQRWEAIGRLAGGVVHDFNNLLTGVMLYCDLLLSSLDTRDRRRHYADEIRSAVMQATGLVKQLLVFPRPPATPVRAVCLNQVIRSMHDLLSRLIGENIVLELCLDPELGIVKVDQSQAQQIFLNLVLNARDALPAGGRITVETSNCRFQPLASKIPPIPSPAFPCILLVVADNGHGMDAATRQRLFEPFFTTKNAGKGTGLGLTTVRSIVASNRGLIHFESEPSRGTRVMILLPRASPSAGPDLLDTVNSDLGPQPAQLFQEMKKESLL